MSSHLLVLNDSLCPPGTLPTELGQLGKMKSGLALELNSLTFSMSTELGLLVD